jgi:tRNA/rRNA methyltransferase
MYASGYLKRKPTTDAEERMRRLVRRLKLAARDMPAWLGILRQILWKLRNPEENSTR